MCDMTGGSSHSLGQGLGDDKNGHEPHENDLLLASSNRRQPHPVNLSVFSSSRAKSEENIPLMSNSETTFTEHDMSHSEFITQGITHPSKLRSSSLTGDATNAIGNKNTDSGHSSLIDSNLAESDADFSSDTTNRNRSQTARASKSEQNLTSECNDVFSVAHKRDRHSSLKDSGKGSSEKMSVNTDETTESSEESLHSNTSDFGCVDRSANSNTYVYIPAHDTRRSFPVTGLAVVGNMNDHQRNPLPYVDLDVYPETTEFGDMQSTDSAQIKFEQDVSCNQPLIFGNGQKLVKGRRDSQNFGFTDNDNENMPLLAFSADSVDSKMSPFSLYSKKSSIPIRKAASLGNISEVPKGVLQTSGHQNNNDTNQISSFAQECSIYSDKMAASPREMDRPVGSEERNFQYHRQWPNPIYGVANPHYPAFYPVPLVTSSPISPHAAHCMSVWPVPYESDNNQANSISENGAPKGSPLQICTVHEGPARPPHEFHPGTFVSLGSQNQNLQLSNPAARFTHACEASSSLSEDKLKDMCQQSGAYSMSLNLNASDIATTVVKSPTQNLESVLGYGTPISSSALKSGSKAKTLGDQEQLKVFVPRMKEKPDGINQITLPPLNDCLQVTVPGTSVVEGSNVSSQETPKPDLSIPMKNVVVSCHQPASPGTVPSGLPYQVSASNMPYVYDTHIPKCTVMGVHQIAAVDNPASRQRNQHTSFPVHTFNPHFQTTGDNLKRYYTSPNGMLVYPDPGMEVLYRNNRMHMAGNQDVAFQEPFYNGVNVMAVDPDSLKVAAENQYNKCQSFRQHQKNFAGCDSEPILHQTGPHSSNYELGRSLGKNYRPKSEYHISSLTPTTQKDQNGHRTGDRPSDQRHSTLFPETVKSGPEEKETKSNKNITLVNQNAKYCVLGHLKSAQNQQDGGGDQISGGNQPASDIDMDMNGYRAGMVVTVPTSCFQPDYFSPQENEIENRSRRESFRHSGHSLPSSIESGVVENNLGTLAYSQNSTSQLGLLKGTVQGFGPCSLSNRDAPDYRILCFVAAIFNPLFGLLALLCNWYARKDYRIQSYKRAHNFYMATIFLSTLGIFLTLVGMALLVARAVVVKSEENGTSATPLLSCRDQYFGHDEFLMDFYNMELDLYCQVSKNEEVMIALKHYWSYDAQMKMQRKAQMQNQKNSTQSNSGANGCGNGGNSAKDNDGESSDVDKKHHLDQNKKHSRFPKNASNNSVLHDTVMASENGAHIPPGLDWEHQRYLKGEKRRNASEEEKLLMSEGVDPFDNLPSEPKDNSNSGHEDPTNEDNKTPSSVRNTEPIQGKDNGSQTPQIKSDGSTAENVETSSNKAKDERSGVTKATFLTLDRTLTTSYRDLTTESAGEIESPKDLADGTLRP